MATGYTYPVADGTCTNLKDFALRCAREFGALVTMRDAPMDAPIPTVIEPDLAYYDARVRSAEQRLDALHAMSQADVEAAITKERADVTSRRTARSATTDRIVARLRAMLVKVEAWKPPTQEHEGLKTFMVRQLKDSIAWENPIPEDLPAADEPVKPLEWLRLQVRDARRDLENAQAARAEEIRRCRERTEWIQELVASLAL